MESPAEFLNRIVSTTVFYLIITWLSRGLMITLAPTEMRVAVNIAAVITTIFILFVFFFRASPFFGMG